MIEALSRGSWLPLGSGRAAPSIGESQLFRLRGFAGGDTVSVGGVAVRIADDAGVVDLKLADEPDVRGHIGLVSIAVNGTLVGEVNVVPDKMSEAAYQKLRSDLEAVWTGLVLDPEGVSALSAGPPPAHDLWRRLEGTVRQILDQPHEVLVDETAYRKAERVRRKRELTPAVLRARQVGGAARVRTLTRSQDTPENQLVVDTLRRLRAHATRTGDTRTAETVARTLARMPFTRSVSPRPISANRYLLDPRYRHVQGVRRLLLRPELQPVEGPGELRLSVQGLSRLYEYWVFLQVLLQARQRYGDPVEPGFDLLRVPTRHGGVRLEIGPGATVAFPGDVHVAFEPIIRLDPARSWMNLEYVPHPQPDRYQSLATPDVVVFRGGRSPSALVIDAKYVGRAWIESAAAAVHAKYARMLRFGVPVVSQVVAVHPHATWPRRSWAGYGHVPMLPGEQVAPLPLPHRLPSPAAPMATVGEDRPQAGPPSSATVRLLLVDQGWMHDHLGDRRIDLAALRRQWTAELVSGSAAIVMPDIPALGFFAKACERVGWVVYRTATVSREDTNGLLAGLAAEHPPNEELILVSGDPATIHAVRSAFSGPLTVVDDLNAVPELRSGV